jgi:sec-independent protein translocase protein TatA
MLGRIGPLELGIVLVIVLLLFGVGRVSKISEELGKSIRLFKKGVTGDGGPRKTDEEDEKIS